MIVWISLEVGHLNSYENSFNEPYKYRFQSIVDDMIISFACFIQCIMLHSMFYHYFESLLSIRCHAITNGWKICGDL